MVRLRIFNHGNCKRDFTYIDDIVEGIIRVMQGAPERNDGPDGLPMPPYEIYNIGNSNPENLMDFVHILSEKLIGAGVLPQILKLRSLWSWWQCSQGMYLSLTPIRDGWSKITDFDQKRI